MFTSSAPLTVIPARALDINFNENSVHGLCQRGLDKTSNKFLKNGSFNVVKCVCSRTGTLMGLERQKYPVFFYIFFY